MKLIFNIKKTLNNVKISYRRFPIAMSFSIISALLFVLGIKYERMGGYNGVYTRYAFLSLMAMVCFVFIGLLLEGFKSIAKNKEDLEKYKLIRLATHILTIPFLYGIKQNMLNVDESLFSYNNSYKYFGLLIFFIVACFYIGRIFYHEDYIAYVIKIIGSGFVSCLYSGVLFIGLGAIYSALTHLFGVKISSEFYLDTAVIVFIPFNFGIFLSNFPTNETSLTNYEVTNATKVLLTYILMPIFTIYLVILYVYFVKILFIGELPKNILIHLILWFSLLSVVYLFILGIILKDSEIVRGFKRIFPVLMIPILLLMFYAITLRIKDYGVTENRYFVVAAGIWALASMIYYVFYRSNSNITIPIILTVTILLSTIGPVSAYNISATSQNARLKKILLNNNMLNGNKIVAKTDISDEDKSKISEIVKYMCSSHRSYELNFVPKDFSCSEESMKNVFGFEHSDSYADYDNMFYDFDAKASINIEGYSKLLLIDSYPDAKTSKIVGNYKIRRKSNLIKIYTTTNESDKELVTLNMEDVKNKLKVLKKSKEIIDPEDLSIKGTSKNIDYKIVFTSLSFYGDVNDTDYYNCSFYLLTNQKN